MKKIIVSIGIVSALLSNQVQVSSESSESQVESHAPEAVKPTQASLGKRKNPVPLGKIKEVKAYNSFSVSDIPSVYTLRVNKVYRGDVVLRALERIKPYSDSYSEGLRSNEELAMVELELDYVSGDEDQSFMTPILVKAFDDTGKEIVQRSVYVPIPDSEQFSEVELFPGASHKGFVAFRVPKGKHFTLAVDGIDAKVFFDITK